MADELKPGDVVKLMGGGPKMTVTHVGTRNDTGEAFVECQWFDKYELKRGDFVPESLKKSK